MALRATQEMKIRYTAKLSNAGDGRGRNRSGAVEAVKEFDLDKRVLDQ